MQAFESFKFAKIVFTLILKKFHNCFVKCALIKTRYLSVALLLCVCHIVQFSRYTTLAESLKASFAILENFELFSKSSLQRSGFCPSAASNT